MMTRCNHIESMLTEYLSDELGPLERAIVDEHLAECEACRIELATVREIADGFEHLPKAACPDDVSRRILAAVDDDLAGRPRSQHRGRPRFWRAADNRSWFGLAGTVAAAVILAVVLPGRVPHSPDTASLPAADSTSIRVDKARQELLWTLAYTASVIDRSEKRSLADVWRQVRSRTPESHAAAIPGGQG